MCCSHVMEEHLAAPLELYICFRIPTVCAGSATLWALHLAASLKLQTRDRALSISSMSSIQSMQSMSSMLASYLLTKYSLHLHKWRITHKRNTGEF